MISFSSWFRRLAAMMSVSILMVSVGCLGPKVDDDAFGRWPNARGAGAGGGRLAPPPNVGDDDDDDGGKIVWNGDGWGEQEARPDGSDGEFIEERDANRWPPVYFAFNQSRIGETERPKLSVVATFLQQNPRYQLLVEGHCDERGSDEYNRALGERRALAVREYLEGLGIDVNRIRTLSYGEERPAVPGQSEQAYAQNRRAEFVMLQPRR